jgi:hypothetical protein
MPLARLTQLWAANRSSGRNEDRPTRWITIHFESEADATEAHKLLRDALKKAVKVEWP